MARARTWEKGFLAVLAESGNVRAACDAAKVSRQVAYAYRADNEAFAAAWALALEEAADLLEQEARRRAYEGWDEPVYGKLEGKFAGEGRIGVVRKYSDSLMQFLLKGAKPEVYRERTDVRHSGKIDVTKLSDDELSAITET